MYQKLKLRPQITTAMTAIDKQSKDAEIRAHPSRRCDLLNAIYKMLCKPCLWYKAGTEAPLCNGFALLCVLIFASLLVIRLGPAVLCVGTPISAYKILKKVVRQ